MLETEEAPGLFGPWTAAKTRLHEGCQHRIFGGEQIKSLGSPNDSFRACKENHDDDDNEEEEDGCESQDEADDAPSHAVSSSASPLRRVHQLEHNIAFLREQHERLLADLQKEVDTLKKKNKALQFQLAMQDLASKFGPSPADPAASAASSSSTAVVSVIRGSPEEIESLENSVKQLQAELHEAKSRNLYLSNLVEEQKNKILLHERLSSATPVSGGRKKPTTSPSPPLVSNEDRLKEDYLSRLQEAEMVIEQLRAENVQQKTELQEIKSGIERNVRLRFRGCNHPTRLSTSRSPSFASAASADPAPFSSFSSSSRRSLSTGSRNGGGGGRPDKFPPLRRSTQAEQADIIAPHPPRKSRTTTSNPELPPVSARRSSNATPASDSGGMRSHRGAATPSRDRFPSLGRVVRGGRRPPLRRAADDMADDYSG